MSSLALYDVVGTPGVAADISHINSKAQVKVRQGGGQPLAHKGFVSNITAWRGQRQSRSPSEAQISVLLGGCHTACAVCYMEAVMIDAYAPGVALRQQCGSGLAKDLRCITCDAQAKVQRRGGCLKCTSRGGSGGSTDSRTLPAQLHDFCFEITFPAAAMFLVPAATGAC